MLRRWQEPTGLLALRPGQLHLWRWQVGLCPANESELLDLLSADERARAERLIVPAKRRQFIQARAGLRQVLGRYLKANPARLIFDYGPQGKPCLSGRSGPSFNLSHSADYALLALSTGGEVGVDLEYIDRSVAYDALAKRYFSATEQACLAAAPSARKCRTFYRIWTAREAALKLTGVGLQSAEPLEEIFSQLHLKTVTVAKGYLASVASQEEITSIKYFQVSDKL